MFRSVIVRRAVVPFLVAVSSLLAFSGGLGIGADAAGASHLTYCGHADSGGYSHGSGHRGRYYWVQFAGQYGSNGRHVHVYREYFHWEDGHNDLLRYYSRYCPKH